VRGLEHGDDDLFEQRSQQLLAVARRGGRRFPYALQVDAQCEQAAPVFRAEYSRSFAFTPGDLGFGLLELAQALLPFALEAAGDETVLGIDSAIAASRRSAIAGQDCCGIMPQKPDGDSSKFPEDSLLCDR
jgi:hypothetical protein